MSIYPNVSREDLNTLSKLAERQKNQRAIKIKNRNLKQTHEKKLAENLTLIPEKLDKVNESTKKTRRSIQKTRFCGR